MKSSNVGTNTDYSNTLTINNIYNEDGSKFTEKYYNYAKDLTKMNKGFWGEIFYKSDTEIVIKPKSASGKNFIGAILNNGKFIYSTTKITVDISTDELSGIGQLIDTWYWLCAYEKANGTLGYAPMLQPRTTISNANPTNSLTLNQVDSKDIGLLFPEDAEFVIWEDEDEYETPLGYIDAGSFNYDPSYELYISNRNATSLTLSQSLGKTDFVSSSILYQVNNFKPLNYLTGNIASDIGTRGWSDTGWRFLTNSSGEIVQFSINDNQMLFAKQGSTGYGDYTCTNLAPTLADFLPPDKEIALIMSSSGNTGVSEHRMYWENFSHHYAYSGSTRTPLEYKHGIVWVGSYTASVYAHGYER